MTNKKAAAAPDPKARWVAVKLSEHAERIRWYARCAADDFTHIGERLCGAKTICPHGEWGTWLKDELGFTPRTAQDYMRVYQCFKSADVRAFNVEISALVLLANSKTPAEVREEAMERSRTERITHKIAREMVREARSESIDRKPPQAAPESKKPFDFDRDYKFDRLDETLNLFELFFTRGAAGFASDIGSRPDSDEFLKRLEGTSQRVDRFAAQLRQRARMDSRARASANTTGPLCPVNQARATTQKHSQI